MRILILLSITMSNLADDNPEFQEGEVGRLLEYDGPSCSQGEPIVDGITYLDYRNTNENEHNIATLLSSQGIPFCIERPKLGWSGTQIRMLVTIPRSERQRGEALLRAAVQASLLEIVKGSEGLASR